MQQKSKRILVAVLAAVLVLALGMGLLFVFLPNGVQKSDIVVELSEDDFEFNYVSSLAYSAGTEETNGDGGTYGWGYDTGDSESANYAYITGIHNDKLTELLSGGTTKLVLNIPEMHNDVPVRYVKQDAFNNCSLSIVDINMPLSVYWQVKGNGSLFTFNNDFAFARADGLTATFTGFKRPTGNGITTLILPSNVWIDKDNDDKIEDNEPKYRYTEYLFKSDKEAPYTNLVVMPDVVNIFNGESGSSADRPKMQGGLLSKSENLKSVYFCTGRSEVLHLYPLTFENCTSLKEISLSAGVYLEDGARVFQGSSALEKFSIADEKTASAPLFYTVGADGALYTNNYSYSYYTQSSTERYYEWWKNDLPTDMEWGTTFSKEWAPTKVWDSQTTGLSLSEPEPKQMGKFEGETTSVSPTTTTTYKAKKNSGTYDGGIGIPEGSYVFDVNGTDKNSGVDNDDDFGKGTGVGQYDTTADFQSKTLTTINGTNNGGTKASISAGSGSVTVTEVSGGNQSAFTATINDVEYKSHMQFKRKSERYLQIKAPFDFELCVYFAGSYAASEAGTTKPQMGLFDKSHFDGSKYKGYTYSASKAAPTAKLTDAIATLEDAAGYAISGGATNLLKIQSGGLKANTDYFVAQPADDPNNGSSDGTSGAAQMVFLVITPLKTQSASSLVVEEDLDLNATSDDVHNWVHLQNDSVILQRVSEECYADLRYPACILNSKGHELLFRVKAVTSGGEVVRTQDIEWAIMNIDEQDVSANISMSSSSSEMDEEGYFTFNVSLQNVFTSIVLF